MLNPPYCTIESCLKDPAFAETGHAMLDLIRRLYPICRSITGNGNRQTLSILAERNAITMHEVPSGTPVFDWIIPPEWNIREAWIKGPGKTILVDFKDHNLHVAGYSIPVHQTLSREDLLPHLHSLPDQPDRIPYRTSYYQAAWAFCITDQLRQSLPDGNYEVFIDADLKPGSLTYGEAVLPGTTEAEFLFSTHICHPSLANDNLSGIAVADQLIRLLHAVRRRYTYRFLFIPGTIGSIAWLARNPEAVRRIRHGLVLSCLGDPGAPHYKRSRQGDALIDRAAGHVLQQGAARHTILDFIPYGYDERQYGSPGIDLPVGLLTRSPHGTFLEYHTSADHPGFVQPEALADSLRLVLEIVRVVEGNHVYRNTSPMGEPQLGRRGLYETLGGANDRQEAQLALLWVLNQSDERHSLLDIAIRSRLPWHRIRQAADHLLACGLLEPSERDIP